MQLEHSSPDEPIQELLARLNEHGYLIFPTLISNSQVDAVRDELAPYLQGEYPGRNDFEGLHSQRVYAVLAKAPSAVNLVGHELSMALAEAVLGPNFLLTACLAIQSEPGESAQAFHFDDSFLRIPRPRPAYSLSTFWALDDCTEENGATEFIPGSHRWGEVSPDNEGSIQRGELPSSARDPFRDNASHLTPELPRGSLMVASGLLWHRGGANRAKAPRLILTPQYCAAWARPQESFLLSIPRETVAKYPKRVRELLGYSIHPPFMGHANGRHPEKSLPPSS